MHDYPTSIRMDTSLAIIFLYSATDSSFLFVSCSIVRSGWFN